MTANPPSSRRSRWPIALVVVIVIAIAVAVGVGSGRFGGRARMRRPSRPHRWRASCRPMPVSSPRGGPCPSAGRSWCQERQGGSPRSRSAVGDTVAEGDVVLQLDDEAAALEVESATAAYTAAQAATARAEASVAQAKANVTASGAAVVQAQAARRSASAARDQVPSGASRAVKRQADAQVDQAEAGVDSARAQRSAAQAAQKTAEAGLAAAKADESRAKVGVAAAELAKDHLAVTSPIAGTVVSIEPAVGDLVQPGVVVARVADASEWRFETSDLSESSIARVREGAAATVTVDGLPGEEIAGTVESVGTYGSSVQGDITYRVVVAPTDAVPEDLRWNMTVTIEIDGAAPGD